jgi:hypothetical protein
MPLSIEINFDEFKSALFNDKKNGQFTPDALLARKAVGDAAKKWESYLTNEEFTNTTAKNSQSDPDTDKRSFRIANPAIDNTNNVTPATVQLSNDIDDILIYVGTAPNKSDTNLGKTFLLLGGQENSFPVSMTSRLTGKQTIQPFMAAISFKDLSQTNHKWWIDGSKPVDKPTQKVVIRDSNGQPYPAPLNNKYVDLYSIALHEIGHALAYSNYPAYTDSTVNADFSVKGTTATVPLASISFI